MSFLPGRMGMHIAMSAMVFLAILYVLGTYPGCNPITPLLICIYFAS